VYKKFKIMRESRHLWVGNLPENIKEDEIRDYFASYGRVEKVKLLIKTSPDGAKAAFVDFVDIKSAVKANEANNVIRERNLRTNFNEPGANKHNFGRGQMFGQLPHGYPPGLDYRPPVVIYAAPPGSNIINAYRPQQLYQRTTDRRFQQQTYQQRRGRSPGSSDGDRSSRAVNYSSDSDSSTAGKKKSKNTVVVKHLGTRTNDANLEEALYHEFKKIGDILNIRIKGSGEDRYAYVQFSSFDEAERATSHTGKPFHGDTLKVTIKGERSSSGKPAYLDDLLFDPHATRTIFVGNLEKNLMHGELRSLFEKFGDVVDVDIKKMQSGITTYAFVQYIDINGATLAKNKMDNQFVGDTRIKVGYGRGTPCNSLWIGNLPKNVMEHQVSKLFHNFGYVQRCLIDKYYWQALVRFETIEACTKAFADMHGKLFLDKRISVDYASPACRDGFYSRMEKKGLLDRRQLEPSPTPPDVHLNFTNVVRGGAFQPRGYAHVTPMAAVYEPAPSTAIISTRDFRDQRLPFDRAATDRPMSNFDFEKELQDYGYGRKRSRSRKEYSPMSKSSGSPPRRMRYNRDSISPVSSMGDRKMKSKIEKKKKRKRSLESPSPYGHEPLRKKEKKKKKEKKDKLKKGTMDFGYDNDEDLSRQIPSGMISTKEEAKREKKERKKVEKLEKEKRKSEKKKRKLEKLQSLQDKLSSIEAAVEKIDGEKQGEVRNEGLMNIEAAAAVPPIHENSIATCVKDETEEITDKDEGFTEIVAKQSTDEPLEQPIQPDITADENKPAQPSEPNETVSKEVVQTEKPNVPSKGSYSSESSSSSSSGSDDSDDSSDGDDDDRDYKHRSYQEREAIARRESERREPKAYRQDRASRETRRDRVPDRFRYRDYSRSRYSDNGASKRSPPSSYRPREKSNSNQSSDRSRSNSPLRSRSKSPYSKHRPYERRKASPPRKPSMTPKETDSRTNRSRRSFSPPPPPPPHSESSARKNEKNKNNSNNPSASTGSNPNAETLLDLLKRFPVLWQGLLGLKNDTAAVQMHFLSGNVALAESSLPRSAKPNEVPPPLRISQRMKLEPSQLDGVEKRIQQSKEHCMLLALPCGRDPLDVHAQTRALKTGFITYLQQKQAAGIVNINSPQDKNQILYVVHIFPPCDFSQGHVANVAPDLLSSAADSGHLMVLITPA